jgi:hypothetical protein
MSGSGASNLGYGNQSPFTGGSSVNSDNSHYSGGFSSNETPMFGKFGLPGAASNVSAANSCVAGLCYKGGSKRLKHKIKNISKMYKKMKGGRKTFKKRVSLLKSKLRSKYHRRGHSRRHRYTMRGGSAPNYPLGHSQYQNNQPISSTYSIGNVKLSASESALANPAPFQKTGGSVDNYNRYTNTGFASRGWW